MIYIVMLLGAPDRWRHAWRPSGGGAKLTMKSCSLDAKVPLALRNTMVDMLLERVGGDELVAVAIEHGVAVWSGMRQRAYRRRMASLVYAIDSTPLWKQKAPWDLAFAREDRIANTQGTDMQSDVLETKLRVWQREPDRPCVRCKSRNLIPESVQRRSADEGMDHFWRCVDCNYQFRM